ncbi:Ras- protein Rab-18-B, partial [Spiromyces aspiralis]
MSRDIEATFKLLFIGESGVGKSSILLRFTDDCFLPPEDTGATIGVDFKVKVRRIKDKRYKITIW